MAKFRTDLNDVYFNLFDLYKVQDRTEMGENDLKEIINELNKFVENEIYPSRQEADHIGLKFENNKVIVPEVFHKMQKQFYENGWYALGYPEDIGGMPAPHTVGLACTSITVGANVAFSMYYGLSKGAMNVIKEIGSQEQKDLYIPQMMSGAWGGTMCLTEPGAGSDVGAAKTTAVKTDKGTYKIKGTKIFISSGENDLYENIIHLVLARTPGAPEGTKGLSLFIVPKFKVDASGAMGGSNDVLCTKIEEKMGIHASATCVLNFGDNGDCEGYLIGEELEGMANMFIMMNEARLLCGLQGESQANLAYELTHQYCMERSQFGMPIAKHPDVKRTLLKMRAISRGMRTLNFYTANLFDQLEKGDKSVEAETALLTPVCKAYCTDEGFNVSVDAIQLHGGYGYCSEYGIEQFARDIKIATIYEGTNAIQAVDFVMRKILKDEAKTFTAMAGKIQAALSKKEAQAWPDSLQMMASSMKDAQKIMQHYGAQMAAKNVNGVLASTTDFLTFCGNLITGWLLLESALVAQEKLAGASGEMKAYYESKIVDYNIFCQHFLVRNLGIAQSILGFKEDLSNLEV